MIFILKNYSHHNNEINPRLIRVNKHDNPIDHGRLSIICNKMIKEQNTFNSTSPHKFATSRRCLVELPHILDSCNYVNIIIHDDSPVYELNDDFQFKGEHEYNVFIKFEKYVRYGALNIIASIQSVEVTKEPEKYVILDY